MPDTEPFAKAQMRVRAERRAGRVKRSKAQIFSVAAWKWAGVRLLAAGGARGGGDLSATSCRA